MRNFEAFLLGILYKADPDPDPDLQKKWTSNIQKKWTLYQNSLYELKTFYLANLRVLISNIKISFLKLLSQKYPNKAFLVKNTQIRHFGPKFWHFCFFAKFCNQTNSRVQTSKHSKVLISNMTILPLNANTKEAQIRHFWSPI